MGHIAVCGELFVADYVKTGGSGDIPQRSGPWRGGMEGGKVAWRLLSKGWNRVV